jgi:hypothetical protein
MRHLKKIIIIFATFTLMGGWAQNSWAIPNLQIYIPGATYDMETETWIIHSYDYDLWVIGAHTNVYDVKFAAAVPLGEDGSISVEWLDPVSADYGGGGVTSLILDEPNGLEYALYRDSYEASDPAPDTYAFASDAVPIMGNGKEIAGHGVFPTDFYEYFIGDFIIGTDIVQNFIPGDEWGDTAPGVIKKFHIAVDGYSWVDIVAYDHIVKSNNKAKFVFSPFSHDGESSAPVPEPATILILSAGFLGLAGLRNRLSKNDGQTT